MNTQFKRGILELCVLALIRKEDRYGYALVQELSQMVEVSEGTVYPLLRRLTKEGYFRTYMETSDGGPVRKYYAVTSTGEERYQLLVQEWKAFCNGVNNVLEK